MPNRRLHVLLAMLAALTIGTPCRAQLRPQKTKKKPPPGSPAPGTIWENPKDGLKYVWIPPGTFIMGCSPGDWVEDWHDENYYHSSPASDARGPSSGQQKVLRGGSWKGGPRYIRASNRIKNIPAGIIDLAAGKW